MTAANGTVQETGMMNGILPVQEIRRMLAAGEIAADEMTRRRCSPPVLIFGWAACLAGPVILLPGPACGSPTSSRPRMHEIDLSAGGSGTRLRLYSRASGIAAACG